ncbi:hypothetical protein T459_12274 [Capsicum annuum]|uniref:F-box domain-containing protein n=1 Tax=Capsicum annuum TaxID=4072 RepID=A0A2G2ZPE6_CAPAN|nr:hypothetical protein T459_12274 [Capsicum annuum]
MSTSMDDHCPLPEDLILFNILLRLPVESLLRFKCVCKHWYALIKSPSFIEKHFHHKNNHASLLICNLEVAPKGHSIVKSVVFSLLPKKIIPEKILWRRCPPGFVEPCIWEDDKMIFEITKTSQLVLYEPTTKQVTDLGFQLDLSITGCWVFNYKESLSPIKRGNDSQGKDNAVEKIEHFFDVIPMDLNPLLTVRKSQRMSFLRFMDVEKNYLEKRLIKTGIDGESEMRKTLKFGLIHGFLICMVLNP